MNARRSSVIMRSWFALATLGIITLAFLARLVPVLSGGGLFGFGNYDDGVYYAAAGALVHGDLPYSDFLLLHPPGIVVLLAPFALLGSLTTDPIGFATARVVWMIGGGVGAGLVILIGRRQGRWVALLGGLAYALYPPAVYGDHTTLLESPANLALLISLMIMLSQPDRRHLSAVTSAHRPRLGGRSVALWLLAGAALAVSPSIKIWGVIVVVPVLIWALLRWGRRQAGLMLIGGLITAVLLLGPFFAAAPARMWRLVVADQLGRPEKGIAPGERLQTLAGIGLWAPTPGLVALTIACWTLALAAALGSRNGRFFVALHAVVVGFLLLSPSWFNHYPTLAAPTAALVITSAAGTLARLITGRTTFPDDGGPARWRRPLAVSLLAATAVMILLVSRPLTTLTFGRPYPQAEVAPAVRSARCVTADDPINLIELNVLSRNLNRNCRLVVDLGGYGYDLRSGSGSVRRLNNPAWQRLALDYLGSGDRAVLSRFNREATLSFDQATSARLRGWPLRAQAGGVVVRQPPRLR